MMDSTELLSKVSGYNILTNIIPGSALYLILKFALGFYTFEDANGFELLVIIYLLGLLCDRVGSLVVGALLKKWGCIKTVDYKLFIKAVDKDSKIDMLLATSNMYRDFLGLCLIVIPVLIYSEIINESFFCVELIKWVVLVVASLIFFFSYKKQTDFITKRVLLRTEEG